MMITVKPHLYTQLGDPTGVHFRVLTNPSWVDRFRIEDDDRYESTGVIVFKNNEDLFEVLNADVVPIPLHLLVVAPDSGFSSPVMGLLGRSCKLLVMPCNSCVINTNDINYYLTVMENTDPVVQKEWSDHFFRHGETAKTISFIDEAVGTCARFNHLAEAYEWFEQLGPVDWGGQQFCPAGEISVLPMFHGQYDPSRFLAISGQIALHGLPIVHSGAPSFLRDDQERIFAELAFLRDSVLVAIIENGVIKSLQSFDSGGARVKAMLESLFTVDSRYRVIWEIGIGANTAMTPLPGNRTPNESYGHQNGCVHWGFGLTPDRVPGSGVAVG